MSDDYISKVLGKDERVVFVTRQHRFILLGQIVTEALLAVAVATLITFIWRRWDPHPRLPLAYLILLVPLVSMTIDVLRWQKRRYFVTTSRVVEVNGILNKEVTDSSLEKINDIKMTQTVVGRMFDYGNVEILTGAEAGFSRFRSVNHPIALKTAMLDAKQELGRAKRADSAPSSEAEILGLLAHLDQLKDHGVLTQQEADQKKSHLLSRLEAKA
jgi:uncharacterized membrane protein YdbT with pleckstrin-like domain